MAHGPQRPRISPLISSSLACRPFGLTFAGTGYSEAQLLAFAYAFEQATHYRKQGVPYKEATPTTQVNRGHEQ